MAMVNTMINPLQVKDSRWLTLEVCREFQRNRCTRPETECKFAHPPAHVEVQNGRVTCCFDSIKGKCQRKDPPCKYLHPPQHLKEQLLQNGRNNLIIKQMQMQALAASQLQPMSMPGVMPAAALMYEAGSKPISYPSSIMPGQYPVVHENPIPRSTFPTWSTAATAGNYTRYQAHPYLMTQNPNVAFNPYMSPSMTGLMPTMDATATAVSGSTPAMQGVISGNSMPNQQKVPRPDRLEGVSAVPGMMPVAKRPAVADNKGGMIPMYQHGSAGTTAAYQQAALAMQLQQGPFVPVTIAGHPPSVPRF